MVVSKVIASAMSAMKKKILHCLYLSRIAQMCTRYRYYVLLP